jgi:hypothetical protein
MLRSRLNFLRKFLLELFDLGRNHKLAIGLVPIVDEIFLMIILGHKEFCRRLQ